MWAPLLDSNSSAALLVIGLSGKRGSGKDFFGTLFKKYLETEIQERVKTETKSLANAFKAVFAEHAGLSFERLMDDREYKELHRKQMNEFFTKINEVYPQFLSHRMIDVRCCNRKTLFDGDNI